MPTPPLRKIRSSALGRAPSVQRTIERTVSTRPTPKPAQARRAANTPESPDDFAFTLDPLSGSVTLHVGRDGTRHLLDAPRPAEEASVASGLGIRSTIPPDRDTPSKGAENERSDLEPRPTAITACEPAAITGPIPTPDAVH